MQLVGGLGTLVDGHGTALSVSDAGGVCSTNFGRIGKALQKLLQSLDRNFSTIVEKTKKCAHRLFSFLVRVGEGDDFRLLRGHIWRDMGIHLILCGRDVTQHYGIINSATK